MFTTHTEQLTKMKITVRSGAVDIRHPSGRQQIHSVEDVLGFQAATITELVLGHKNLEVYNQWLKDMGSPLPAESLKEQYLSLHEKWLAADSPESWLQKKGILTKIIGLVERE